jgi:hypothetical protein
MTTPHRPATSRPWYCNDALVEDYRVVAANGGDFAMLRTLKILRSIIVNLGIIGVTLVALLYTGADATLVSAIGLITLGAFNGVEVADYAALAQAFTEVRREQANDSGGDGQ